MSKVDEINNNAFFSESDVQRDESIPLDALIKSKKENASVNSEQKASLSPLEQMKLNNEKTVSEQFFQMNY